MSARSISARSVSARSETALRASATVLALSLAAATLSACATQMQANGAPIAAPAFPGSVTPSIVQGRVSALTATAARAGS